MVRRKRIQQGLGRGAVMKTDGVKHAAVRIESANIMGAHLGGSHQDDGIMTRDIGERTEIPAVSLTGTDVRRCTELADSRSIIVIRSQLQVGSIAAGCICAL